MVAGNFEIRDGPEPAGATPGELINELSAGVPRCLENDRHQSDKNAIVVPFVSSLLARYALPRVSIATRRVALRKEMPKQPQFQFAFDG